MRKSGVDAAKKATSNGKFPIGMRVMAVDDDIVCLKLLETQLIECGYEVTATQHPRTALKLLKENSDDYDLVISDVRMPEMDGFRLLEMIGPEIGIPVIMLSVDSEVTTVMKGIKRGACDYLVKPARLQDLKIIWKHVAMKSINDTREANDQSYAVAPLARVEDDCSQKPTRKHHDRGKEKEDEGSNYSDDDNSMQKKPRVSWSQELHAQFIRAVNQLGVDRAVPKKILDLMNVPGLSRENVASHLQKYRNAIKRGNIGVHPQVDGGIGSHGFGANPRRSVFVSYSGRGIDGAICSSAGGYHQTATLFGHDSVSQIASAVYPLPINHSQLLQQHHASTSQDGQLTKCQFVYGSNASVMSFRNQSEFNQLTYQSLTPRPTHVNDYLGYSSQDPWANTVEPLQSLVPETLNEDPIQFLADTASSLCGDPQGSFSEALDALLPNKQLEEGEQKLCTSADPQELGIQTKEKDALNMQNNNQEHFEGICRSELADPLGEHSATENVFHFNKCDSADDLHAVLRQFQQ